MSNKTEAFASSDSTRLMHGVGYQATLEKRRIQNAKKGFVILNIVLAMVLFLDYSMGFALFDYIAPEVGGSKLGAATLALIFPVAVLALHFRIIDKDGTKTENHLRQLAGIGIFIFLLGASSLIAAIMFEGASGIGSSFSSGAGLVIGEMIGQSQQTPSPLTSIPPILFFFAMGFGLILTFYVSHRLLTRLEDHYQIFSNASKRHLEVGELIAHFDAQRMRHDRLGNQRRRLARKLPRDPEMAFAQILSAAIHKELRQHRKALSHFTNGNRSGDVVTGELARKSEFPDHIQTREIGIRRIAEIKDALRPFAVLGALDALPPKDEEF